MWLHSVCYILIGSSNDSSGFTLWDTEWTTYLCPVSFGLSVWLTDCRVTEKKKKKKEKKDESKSGSRRAESDLTKIKKMAQGRRKLRTERESRTLKRENRLWKMRKRERQVRAPPIKQRERKKVQPWQEKLRRFPESSSARRTHPASLAALPQPFNWFNSPKWSLSVSLSSFFLGCHIWDALLSLFHSKSV